MTIKEVARAAGVSVATVSRVLNDSGPVNPDTRSRVQAAAGSLRYIPHGGARSLITSRTNTLGVLLPDLYGEFFSEVIRGIDLTAKRNGYHLLVSCAHDDRSEIEAALRAMRGRVDGLIVMSPDIDAASLVANLPDSQPVVLLNCAATDGAVDSLTIDNVGGARMMVRHLIGHGCRRVAIIGGAERNLDARERLRGYRAALREAGIARDPTLELPGDFTEASGFDAARRLVRLHPRPTAIFAANDSMAIGALSALREAGVRVPEDVAVAGFDDIPIARYMSPPLSSVHVPIAELGEHAMRKLLAALGNRNGHARRQEMLATTLVIRDSCGAPGHA
ncbi:MAG: LacI family transcriptional regulator [Gemmatimonadota bacterium]|nr:LacI family transcriptional regulator [Gemmatimonadota bacterium]